MRNISIALASLLLSSAAMAQGYIGFAGGTTKQDVNCAGLTSCDTSDTGYKLYAGYKFAPIFGGELTYTDFGKVKGHYYSTSANYQTTSFGIGGAVFAPLAPRATAVVRFGVASNKATVTASLGSFSSKDSETKTHPYFGLGLGIEATPGLSITGGYDLTKTEYGGETSNATLLSIGLSYTF